MFNNTIPAGDPRKGIIAHNKFGTFYGFSQKVFDSVWNKLTRPDGNSVVYISMEIGADLDVYNPVKTYLQDLHVPTPDEDGLAEFHNKLMHGPEKIPNYGGGLGILAGDTLKSFADCKLPVIAISLLYRCGYFSQVVDSQLGQLSNSVTWHPEQTANLYLLRDPDAPEKPLHIEIPFLNEYDQETMALAQVWMKLEPSSTLDFFVPEILLDFYLPESPTLIREASKQLYNAESSTIKAVQRRMLGTGILPVLKALGITSTTLHLNEQHGVVVTLQLIAEELQKMILDRPMQEATEEQIISAAQKVSERLVYTIHTPVKAGHDRFDKSLYAGLSRKSCQRVLDVLASDDDNPHEYNFTNMAMRINRCTNSVSRLHRDVTQHQFPQFAKKISAITNGVHHLTWISDNRAALFDSFRPLSTWREDPGIFAQAESLMQSVEFKEAFAATWKKDTTLLIDFVNTMLLLHRKQMTETWIDPPNHFSSLIDQSTKLSPDVFTIGFARRFSTYKRADLIFDDIDKLCDIVVKNGWPLTLLFAGKAHPADEPGKIVIKAILDYQEELHRKSNGLANLIFIPNYDMNIAKMLVSGVHCWLNSPKRPLEASGTSGMKAAMNGVPNISIMDGWWVEGYHNGATGWKFGHEGPVESANLSESREELLYHEDSNSFYELLPNVLKSFYDDNGRSDFLARSIMNLVMNIPIFNTHRMAAEYQSKYGLRLSKQTEEKILNFAQLYSSDK